MAKQKGTTGKPSANGTPERLAAYFLSLSLENVRCFGPKQTLDFSDGHGKPAPWTIILGLNGTGKTTLLQSILAFQKLAVASTKFELEHLRAFSDDFTLPLLRGEERIPLEVSLLTASGSSLGTSQMIVAQQPSRISLWYGGHAVEKEGAIPFCFAYGASRRLGSASLSDAEVGDPTVTLFSDRAELRNAEEWLLQLDYAAKADKHNRDAQQRFDQAKALLLAIMPEGEITDVRCIAGTGPNPKARAEFQTPDGWVPLRQLGYGYQTLITWVTDLANRMAERYPESANPLAEPAVVLVDEIDLHLHPIWQRKLIGFLSERFPNTQFIATAHSPLVVQAAADANLAVLRREGDHVVIDNEVDNIRNWRIDQILTSDLFGLKTARPPQIEAALEEREKILTKPKLTAGDKRRLEELETEIGHLPFGETQQEREEREEIRKTLELLMKDRKQAK